MYSNQLLTKYAVRERERESERYSSTTVNQTPRYSGHGFSVTAPRESNGKKTKKRIKNEVLSVLQEVPNVLLDSTQGAAEGSNPMPYSLGRRLGPLPY